MLIKVHRKSSSSESFCRLLINSKNKDEKAKQQNFKTLHKYASLNFPKSGNFKLSWLKKVLLKIDKIWYNNYLFHFLTGVYGGVFLTADDSDPEVAGYVLDSDKTITLSMNKFLFMNLFDNGDTGYHAGGLVCTERLSCLLHVILHETSHLLLTVCQNLGHHKNTRHHGKEFAHVTYTLFGHVNAQHGLIHGLNPNTDYLTTKRKLRVGLHVSVFYKTKYVPGVIININRNFVDVKTSKFTVCVNAGLIKIPQLKSFQNK
jgi:hypothetical protein